MSPLLFLSFSVAMSDSASQIPHPPAGCYCHLCGGEITHEEYSRPETLEPCQHPIPYQERTTILFRGQQWRASCTLCYQATFVARQLNADPSTKTQIAGWLSDIATMLASRTAEELMEPLHRQRQREASTQTSPSIACICYDVAHHLRPLQVGAIFHAVAAASTPIGAASSRTTTGPKSAAKKPAAEPPATTRRAADGQKRRKLHSRAMAAENRPQDTTRSRETFSLAPHSSSGTDCVVAGLCIDLTVMK